MKDKILEDLKVEFDARSEAGIKKYNAEDDSFSAYSPKGLVKYFAFTSMLEDKNGDIWFGTYHGGLYQYIKENL